MRFRLVKTGKSHADPKNEAISSIRRDAAATPIATPPSANTDTPVVWRGTTEEYHRLLVLREAELVVAKASLTGSQRADWWIKNSVLQLEMQVADLKKWIKEASENGS